MLSIALTIAGCSSSGLPFHRDDVVRRMVASTVQLRTEREGGAHRAGSGVVIATDEGGSWVLTTRHLFDPPAPQTVSLAVPGRARKLVRAQIEALSAEADLALLRIGGLRLEPVTLKDGARLGDAVWVVAFPWGKKLTMVGGAVSQITSDDTETRVEGPPSMIDASVSYGASGGGVFDAETGALVALVESHRTARVMLPDARDRSFDVPVPGETTVISSTVIRRFLAISPIAPLVQP